MIILNENNFKKFDYYIVPVIDPFIRTKFIRIYAVKKKEVFNKFSNKYIVFVDNYLTREDDKINIFKPSTIKRKKYNDATTIMGIRYILGLYPVQNYNWDILKIGYDLAKKITGYAPEELIKNYNAIRSNGKEYWDLNKKIYPPEKYITKRILSQYSDELIKKNKAQPESMPARAYIVENDGKVSIIFSVSNRESRLMYYNFFKNLGTRNVKYFGIRSKLYEPLKNKTFFIFTNSKMGIIDLGYKTPILDN